MSDEAWKPVVGWEDRYWVSSWGRVWSMHNQRFLKTPLRKGYPHVHLCGPGRHRSVDVHMIEMEAFAGLCPADMETRHINGIKTDLRWPENLVYATPVVNQSDRIVHGTSNRGERHGLHRLTESDVLEIYARQGEPHKQLAAAFGVSRQCVGKIHQGQRWAWLTGASGSVEARLGR